MILTAARRAAANLTEPEFRTTFWKTIGLTLLVLIALWFGLRYLFEWLLLPWLSVMAPDMPGWAERWADWFGVFAGIAAGLGLAAGLALLIAPVTAIIAGLFLDDVAEVVEKRQYPEDPPGEAVPLVRAAILSLKFFGIVILGNLLALTLLLVPGVNLIAFFVVNGYLLGREFFEFAAMRFRSEDEAKALRKRHSGTVLIAGFMIAALLAVPVLNLATPLFAAALMVHLHKAISKRDALA
ncbi:sulfate transporter family protein [Aliihoeflea sp. PC F10.4]